MNHQCIPPGVTDIDDDDFSRFTQYSIVIIIITTTQDGVVPNIIEGK